MSIINRDPPTPPVTFNLKIKTARVAKLGEVKFNCFADGDDRDATVNSINRLAY